MTKKLFISLVSIILAFSLIPLSALAEEGPIDTEDIPLSDKGMPEDTTLEGGSIPDTSLPPGTITPDGASPEGELQTVEGGTPQGVGTTPQVATGDALAATTLSAEDTPTARGVGTREAGVLEVEHKTAGELANEINDAAAVITNKDDITTLKIVVKVNSFNNPDHDTAMNLNSSYKNLTNLVLDYSSFTDASVPFVFYDCSWIKSLEITDGATVIGVGAFSGCSALASVVLPQGITEIGIKAFGNTALTEFEVPKATQVLPGGAFNGCQNLTSFTVATDNTVFEASDGVLFKDDMGTLVRYPEGKSSNSYTIPDSVETIGDDAFFLCDSLTTIDIPESVTSIGDRAFYDCDSLTTIDIPENVTSIGNSAFYSCSSLTSINISADVTSIADSAFRNCDSLALVVFRGQNTPTVSNSAFRSISSSAKAYVPEGKKDVYVAALRSSLSFPDPDNNVHEITLDVAIPTTAIALDVSGEVLPSTSDPISYSNKATDSVVIDGYFTAVPDDLSAVSVDVTDFNGNALEAGKYYPSAKATITALNAGKTTVRLRNDTGSTKTVQVIVTNRRSLSKLLDDVAKDIASLDEDDYKISSWQALEAAIPTAVATYNDKTSSQADLDDAYDALDKAHQALKLKQVITIKVTEGDANAFYVGDTLTLTTSDNHIPSDTSRFTWNADYLDLKVSSPARVTAKKVGTTTVTYMTPDGEEASLSLTILPAKEKASTPVSTNKGANTGGSSPKTSDGVFLTLVFPILCLAFLSLGGMFWARARRQG